jgi:Transposase DDE domain
VSALKYVEDQWKFLLDMLPQDVDLETSARETGAFLCPRIIRTAETLLRIVFAYCCCQMSLRDTGDWAERQGLGKLSQVAVLKCLQRSTAWLSYLLGAKLAERAGCSHLSGVRFRLVDATTASGPGSKGTDWRLHVGFDLGSQSIDAVEVTGPEGGEGLSRLQLQEGEVVIGDRGYANRRGLWSVVQAGARFLVRLNWQNLPLQTLLGMPFDLFEALRQVGETATEFSVQTSPDKDKGIPAIPARLVALRKIPEAAEKSRSKVIREAKKKGRKVNPLTLEASAYIFVLTSIPAPLLTAAQILDLYRFRWQIEMAFKRFKAILPLGEVPTKGPAAARTYLLTNLLAVLLIEDLTRKFLAFPPSEL